MIASHFIETPPCLVALKFSMQASQLVLLCIAADLNYMLLVFMAGKLFCFSLQITVTKFSSVCDLILLHLDERHRIYSPRKTLSKQMHQSILYSPKSIPTEIGILSASNKLSPTNLQGQNWREN